MREKTEINDSIAIYEDSDSQVFIETTMREDTIWLTQAQISQLFRTERSVITKHLRNIFKSGELDGKSNVQKMHIPSSDKPVMFYNLDAIISVGYKVNSKRATQFRIWATHILKEHLVKGFTLNYKRLAEVERKRLDELYRAVELIKKTIENRELTSQQENGLLRIITEYAHSWLILHKFDEGSLRKPEMTTSEICGLNYEQAKRDIVELKKELLNKKEVSELFGQETGGGFHAIIGCIYQTFDGKELYPDVESKAAHLLYFIIKDHPFIDGNKRSAAFFFVLFLDRNGCLNRSEGERKINDNALVALTLLVAESDPKDKELIIKLIINLISEKG